MIMKKHLYFGPAFLSLCLFFACDSSGSSDQDASADEDSGQSVDAGMDSGKNNDAGSDSDTDADSDTDTDADADADSGMDASWDASADGGNMEGKFIVVTFNTGTTDTLLHNSDGDDYGSEQVDISDEWYGNGLAWVPAIEAVTDWFADLQPDVVVFQEIFYSGLCPGIPADKKDGFVCEDWVDTGPTVAQIILGSGYQVACHPGKDDKCIAVKKSFGSIRQCTDDYFCLEGLDGERVDQCGGGARVARATIDLVEGGEITVLNYHGSSGITSDDMECRAKQVEQVFDDMDGEPGANGDRNVVLGDLNTDPGRVSGLIDESVAAWKKYVGPSKEFHWISPIGTSATPTYTGGLNIDHVVSDVFTGSCYAPGATPGYPKVYENVLFDHKPLVCTIGDL